MTVKRWMIISIVAGPILSGCSGLWGYDEFERYTQRTDAITMSAGDAKSVNAVTHMHSPWPPEVGNRMIVADGPRMQRALDRYRRQIPPPDPLPAIGKEGEQIGRAVPPETAPPGTLNSLPTGSSVNIPVGGQ